MKRKCPQCGLIAKHAAWDHGEAGCPRCGARLERITRMVRKGGDPKVNHARDLPDRGAERC